jgi:hypothetical protein
VQDGVGENVPVEFVVKLTVPVGVVALEDVSVTVAVQLVAVPAVTAAGEHATLVVVPWGGTEVAERRKVPLLDACVESPP